jgi:hypothetical protein
MKPTAAGNTDQAPSLSFISIAGMSSDHTDAATITPEANPNRAFCNRSGISLRMKNTNDDPSIVPNKGIINPNNIVVIAMQRYTLLKKKGTKEQNFLNIFLFN